MTIPGGTGLAFVDAIARLTKWPDPLPAPPAVLMPVRTDGVIRFPNARIQGEATRNAAVLVLIVPDDDGEARVILTERVDRGGHHSGEGRLPGGSAEPENDEVPATGPAGAPEGGGHDADPP